MGESIVACSLSGCFAGYHVDHHAGCHARCLAGFGLDHYVHNSPLLFLAESSLVFPHSVAVDEWSDVSVPCHYDGFGLHH